MVASIINQRNGHTHEDTPYTTQSPDFCSVWNNDMTGGWPDRCPCSKNNTSFLVLNCITPIMYQHLKSPLTLLHFSYHSTLKIDMKTSKLSKTRSVTKTIMGAGHKSRTGQHGCPKRNKGNCVRANGLCSKHQTYCRGITVWGTICGEKRLKDERCNTCGAK